MAAYHIAPIGACVLEKQYVSGSTIERHKNKVGKLFYVPSSNDAGFE